MTKQGKMRFDIISIQPQLFEGIFGHSILERAIDKGLIDIHIHDLRAFGLGKQKQVDDYQYGGGSGMVLMVEPMVHCIRKLQSARTYDEIIYLSPDGEQWTQAFANYYSSYKNLLLICGHYKGIDQRVRDHFVTKEISVGEFVLTGGEIPAALLVDSIARLLPGAINDATSALSDSFQDGLIAAPVYTRPANFEGMEVPKVLLSGHEAKIKEWRHQQSEIRTKAHREGKQDSKT